MQNIQITEDYNLFRRIPGNRTINKNHVERLKSSLGENPELTQSTPILVNDKMQIIDGQHRFEALRKLGLPIAYMVVNGLTLREVQIVNSSTKNWNPVDFAKSYRELGNENYSKYLEFKSKYKVSHAILLLYLSNKHSGGGMATSSSFNLGKFVIADEAQAHKLCQRLTDIAQYYHRGTTRVFAIAFRKIALHPDYDHERMIEKVKAHNRLFKDSPTAEDYMRQLEKIYNFHCGVNRTKLF